MLRSNVLAQFVYKGIHVRSLGSTRTGRKLGEYLPLFLHEVRVSRQHIVRDRVQTKSKSESEIIATANVCGAAPERIDIISAAERERLNLFVLGGDKLADVVESLFDRCPVPIPLIRH